MREPQHYILLLDDDKDDLEMLSSVLKLKGTRVQTFESSAKALFYLTLMAGNAELPSLIIMDYNMPKKNGHQVLLLLKENKDTKDIPVVIYSTSMPDLLKKQLLNAGALDCFVKPWTCRELTEQVKIFQDLTYSFISNKSLA